MRAHWPTKKDEPETLANGTCLRKFGLVSAAYHDHVFRLLRQDVRALLCTHMERHNSLTLGEFSEFNVHKLATALSILLPNHCYGCVKVGKLACSILSFMSTRLPIQLLIALISSTICVSTSEIRSHRSISQ